MAQAHCVVLRHGERRLNRQGRFGLTANLIFCERNRGAMAKVYSENASMQAVAQHPVGKKQWRRVPKAQSRVAPCRRSGQIDLNTGGAIGEEFGLCIRHDVSAFPGAHGQPAGDGGNGSCDCARGISHVEVQSGVRRDRRNGIREEVRRTASQILDQESRQARLPTRPGLSRPGRKKGVLG